MLLTFSDLIGKVPGTSGPVNANSELVSPKQRSNKQYKHDYYSFSTEVLSFACYQHLLISTFWAISLKTHYILWKNCRSLVLAVNSLVKFALFYCIFIQAEISLALLLLFLQSFDPSVCFCTYTDSAMITQEAPAFMPPQLVYKEQLCHSPSCHFK